MHISTVNIVNGERCNKYCYCKYIGKKSPVSFRFVYLDLILASKGQGQGRANFYLWISSKRWQIEQTLLMPSDGRSIDFSLTYLHLTGRILKVKVDRHSILRYRKLSRAVFRRVSASTLPFLVLHIEEWLLYRRVLGKCNKVSKIYKKFRNFCNRTVQAKRQQLRRRRTKTDTAAAAAAAAATKRPSTPYALPSAPSAGSRSLTKIWLRNAAASPSTNASSDCLSARTTSTTSSGAGAM